jgi:heme A synthase
VIYSLSRHAESISDQLPRTLAPVMNGQSQKQFARFTLAVLGWTMLTIIWGAYVRASGSGAGCGRHWPLCNGQVIPQAQQVATVIEFVHRLLSGGALILIGVMVVWGFRVHPRGSAVRKALVAAGVLIVTEALVGASLVLFGWVTTNVSAARAFATAVHLLNTFLLLASVALTSWWAHGQQPPAFHGRRMLPWILLIGLVGVMLIGISGAITALGDTIFPASTLAQGLAQDRNPNSSFLIHLRIYHPLIAILVGLYLITMAIGVRDSAHEPVAHRLGTLLIGAVLIQWALGLSNYLLLVPVWTQLSHLFMADVVWMTLVVFCAAMLAVPGIQAIPEVPRMILGEQ